MDRTYPPDAWQRLGKDLERRRGQQLGYGYRERPRFLLEYGGPQPRSLKMIERLERGERHSYPVSTVTWLENLYRLRPGSFTEFLDAVTAGDEDAAERVITAAPVPAAAPPAPAGDEPATREEQFVHRILQAGEQDRRVLQHIMDRAANADGALLPWPDRLHKMDEWLTIGAGTITWLENLYRLRPGSFLDAVTAGDEDAAERVITAAPIGRQEQLIHRILWAEEHDLRVLRQMYVANNADGVRFSWPDRLHMMEEWLASSGPADAADPEPGGSRPAGLRKLG